MALEQKVRFRFTCPHCGHQSLVDEELAGREGPCAGCGRPVRIPEPEEETLDVVVPDQASWAWGVLALAGLLLLAGFLWGAWLQWNRWRQQRAQRLQNLNCEDNMQRILAALMAYQHEHGRLPPAWTVDGQGRRLHSWRVLILPYLGYGSLYDQIRLNEPWDSPHNRQFHEQMPAEFRCPVASGSLTHTSYLVAVGPRFAFTGAEGRPLDQLQDPPRGLVLLVEVANKSVPWMKPEDLEETELDYFVNSATAAGVSSHHPGGAHVATLSGHVVLLPDRTDPAVVRQALQVDDGQPAVLSP